MTASAPQRIEDRTSPPLYGRIVEDLRRDIESGIAKPGSGLPSERELEERYGVSRITVRRALEELARAGLIERSQGKRTIVLGPASSGLAGNVSGGLTDMLHLGRVTNAKLLAFEWRLATPEVAAALEIQEGDQVLYVARLRVRDGEPMFHGDVYLPRRVGLLIDRSMLERAPILDLMIENGIAIENSVQTMSAAPCPDWLAPLLAVDIGSPTFRIERIVRDRDERPVQYLVGYFRWDRHSYRIEAYHREPDGSQRNVKRPRTGLVAL